MDDRTNILDLDRNAPEALGEALGHALGLLAGYASLCWDPKPEGVFQSDELSPAVDEAANWLLWRATLTHALADGPLYAVLVEHNGHEGETWRHYIPCEGNQEAIDALRLAIEEAEEISEDDDIEFGWDAPIQENYVDDRISMGDSGYMDAHTKLAGRLGPLPEAPEGYEDDEQPWVYEVLYKGGVRHLMEEG